MWGSSEMIEAKGVSSSRFSRRFNHELRLLTVQVLSRTCANWCRRQPVVSKRQRVGQHGSATHGSLVQQHFVAQYSSVVTLRQAHALLSVRILGAGCFHVPANAPCLLGQQACSRAECRALAGVCALKSVPRFSRLAPISGHAGIAIPVFVRLASRSRTCADTAIP